MKKLPPLVIVVTAYDSAHYLGRCIDSLLVAVKHLPIPFRILVGIDGCEQTRVQAIELQSQLDERVEFHFSPKNVGTYILKNSLLKKVTDKDSLILFFDADDLVTPNFLLHHYTYMQRMSDADSFGGLLRVQCLEIEEKFIERAHREDVVSLADVPSPSSPMSFKHCEELIPVLIASILGEVDDDFSSEYLALLNRFVTLEERCGQGRAKIKPNIRKPHGVFFCAYRTLEDLGFFHEFRVAQDSDFQKRAQMSGHELLFCQHSPYFLRSISGASLTNNTATSIGSDYRSRVVEENERRREAGIIRAEGISIPLELIS